MKKIAMILLSFITITLLVAGCSSSKDIQDFSIEEIALEEAKKITSEQGYTLKSETLTESDIMIGDSKVFDFIKEASIEGGYSKDDFNSITEDRKIVGYELEEKSKIDVLRFSEPDSNLDILSIVSTSRDSLLTSNEIISK